MRPRPSIQCPAPGLVSILNGYHRTVVPAVVVFPYEYRVGVDCSKSERTQLPNSAILKMKHVLLYSCALGYTINTTRPRAGW